LSPSAYEFISFFSHSGLAMYSAFMLSGWMNSFIRRSR
jgi:hypothetical protein